MLLLLPVEITCAWFSWSHDPVTRFLFAHLFFTYCLRYWKNKSSKRHPDEEIGLKSKPGIESLP